MKATFSSAATLGSPLLPSKQLIHRCSHPGVLHQFWMVQNMGGGPMIVAMACPLGTSALGKSIWYEPWAMTLKVGPPPAVLVQPRKLGTNVSSVAEARGSARPSM